MDPDGRQIRPEFPGGLAVGCPVLREIGLVSLGVEFGYVHCCSVFNDLGVLQITGES